MGTHEPLGDSRAEEVDACFFYVEVERTDGSVVTFPALVRIDQPAELEYFRDGGVLRTVVRQLL